MADSLVIASTFELMMGDLGPVMSTIPGLENTTIALDDQNDKFDLGTHQPTVDILASLITDGERPQGRRSSNRILSIPIAIISDTRDNLSYAREMVFRLADQESFTTRYTRDGSSAPMILDCWRAEPADVTYQPVVEQQFACQLVLNFEALPFGRSDSPNSISFKSPAAGTAAPPGPILVDGFNTVQANWPVPWKVSPVCVSGDNSLQTVANGNLSNAWYRSFFNSNLDLTSGGAGLNNVFQFWAGFGSQLYYNNWANHQSEITFSIKLYDINNNTLSAVHHNTFQHSNNLGQPKWTNVSCRIPAADPVFDYTRCTSYEIRCYNHLESGNPWLKDSTLFLCGLFAASPSSSVQNVTRGSIYQVNGVEGSVHTPVSIAATQKPGTSVTTVNYSGSGVTNFIPPAGVIAASVNYAIGPGGPGGPNNTDNAGGGGAEQIFNPSVPVTPGSTYPINNPAAVPACITGAFAGAFTQCGSYSTASPITGITQNFTAAVAVGNSVFFQLVLPASPVAFNGTLTVADNAGNGNYTLIANSIAPDGTFVATYALFNIQHAIAISNTYTISMSPTQLGATLLVNYAPGLLSSLPMAANAGSLASGYVSDGQWIDTVNSEPATGNVNTAFWTDTGCTTAVNTAAASGGLSSQSLQATSTVSTGTASITSGVIPVDASAPILIDLIARVTASGNRSVTVGYNWLNAAGGVITGSSFSMTFVNGVWDLASQLSGFSTSLTPASGTRSVQYSVSWSPTAVGETIDIQAVGPRLAGADNPAYIAIVGNNSGIDYNTAPPGWTHVANYGNSATLGADIFYIKTAGIGGGIFGSPTLYASAIPWSAAIVRVSDMAGWSGFIADNGVRVIAHGGQPGSLSSTAGGLGGFGSNAPVHFNGGNGATSPGVAGGGGGSSAGSSTATAVDDTDGTIAYSSTAAVPYQITADWSSSSYTNFGYYGYFYYRSLNNVTINGNITINPQMTSNDTIAVVVVASENQPTVVLQDTQGNSYSHISNATIGGGSGLQAQLFISTSHNALSAGDQISVNANASNSDSYAVQAYIIKGGANVSGKTVSSSFTGTSSSPTITGLTGGPNAHFGITFATDKVVTTLDSLPSESIGNAEYTKNIPSADESFGTINTGGILQAFWKNAGGSSTTFALTRPTSGTVGYAFTTFTTASTNWSIGTNSAYRGGTSHIAASSGLRAVITVSGTHFQIVGKKGPDQGVMLVSVDGGSFVSADNYRSVAAYQQVLFDTGTLASGSHTITIVNSGTSNPSSSNILIDIDGYNTVTAGSGGAGSNASGSTGGSAGSGAGAGGNGATSAGNGSAGTAPGGGGGGGDGSGHVGGASGAGAVSLSYSGVVPTYKTLLLHRPFIDGSRTLLPYIACQKTSVPTSDMVQGIYPNVPPHFQGTYSFMIAGTFNTPANARTVTVTVNEFESAPGGVLPSATSTQSVSKTFKPNDPIPLGAPNGMITIGELTLPNKDIPPDNTTAVYQVIIASTNSSDVITDVMMLDTMGQTVQINEATGYSTMYIDEPTPDRDIGRIMGSQYDRNYAISIMDSAFPSGGPLTLEPGDNILFAYCVEGAPALVASYFPRYFIDRTAS